MIKNKFVDFEKLRLKIMNFVVEQSSTNGYKHCHPNKFNIKIPVCRFEKDELTFLHANEFKFQFVDDTPNGDISYQCYKFDAGFILTNEINLLYLFKQICM